MNIKWHRRDVFWVYLLFVLFNYEDLGLALLFLIILEKLQVMDGFLSS
jgi:hypothetical protein